MTDRLVPLPPEARRRQRQQARREAEAVSSGDMPAALDLSSALTRRYRDLHVPRNDLRADALELAEAWRIDARKLAAQGEPRRSLLYYLAADALEGWAGKVFAPTTIWPGL